MQKEPPMFLQRPSSVKSQDVTHILARNFRELFTKDAIAPEIIENLNVTCSGDDAYHQRYVSALQVIQEDYERRLAEAAMLERHIMQAQARALSAEEREANRLNISVGSRDNVYVPPAQSYFRSCINSELLKKHNLLSADDFTTMKPITFPLPQGPKTPHYAQETRQNSLTKPPKNKRCTSAELDQSSTMHKSADSDLELDQENECQTADKMVSDPEVNLWKKQVSVEERNVCRTELSNLNKRTDYLKVKRHVPPSLSGSGGMITKPQKKLKNECVFKTSTDLETSNETLQTFLAVPSVITFTDYKIGQVYEMTLELKNVTSVLRSVHIIPPATPYFSVGLGQYPGEHGLVAPGLSCLFAIRFSPDSLSDFDDVLVVGMQSPESLHIPLQGRRPPPVLTIPPALDVGDCLVNSFKVCQFTVKNDGGPGKFTLVPSSSWPSANVKTLISAGFIQLGKSFEVRPVIFELKSGQTTNIDVLFSPKSVEAYSESLTIVCDNCHVKQITVTGEGKVPKILLVDVEDGLSEQELGELVDVSAQHLIRFPNLNPFTYMQKKITVQNCINVELPFYWITVRPHIIAHNSQLDSSESIEVPMERVQDLDSPFCVEPETGVLAPGGKMNFTVTFAPPAVQQFHSSHHLVLRYFIQKPENDECKSEVWATKSIVASNNGPEMTESTALEIETKAVCDPYDVSLRPCVLRLQEKTLVETTIKKTFKIVNCSLSSVIFRWVNVNCSYILNVEPSVGELSPQTDLELELSISSSYACQIDHLMHCYLQNVDEPITLHVVAEIKGPEIVVEQPDINFGLVQFGDCVTSTLTLRNTSRVPAQFVIKEVNDPELSELDILPSSSGEIRSLDTIALTVRFRPQFCRSFRTTLSISALNGNESLLVVYAEVQTPAVCLLSSKLEFEDAYLDVPVTRRVTLYNKTVLPTPFQWNKVEGYEAKDCSVHVEPEAGILQSREQLDINVTFTGSLLGSYGHLMLTCSVQGMESPLCLLISAVVRGLNVSYRTLTEPDRQEDVNERPLMLDFGVNNAVGSVPKRYLYIKNNSGISAPYSVTVEHYTAPTIKPPTPPEKKANGKPTNISQRKYVLDKTPNLADPVPKTAAQIQADLCKNILRCGRGAAFCVNQPTGILPANEDIFLEISGYSDTWGTYMDRLLCQVGCLDTVYISMMMTTVGCPVYFQMNNPKVGNTKAAIRFGGHPVGADPVVRKARIINTSAVDVRLDWDFYLVCEDDVQLLDLVSTFGMAFPEKDDSGKEIIPADKVDVIQATNRDCCCESEASNDNVNETPQVVTLTLRKHGGKLIERRKPFEILQQQCIIPSYGNKELTFKFYPDQPCIFEQVSYNSFGLAYISLAEQDRQIENLLFRPHQYAIDPVHVEVTGQLIPPQLEVQYENDEGVYFEMAASDLWHYENELKSAYMKVCGITLCNRSATILKFRLFLDKPFLLVELNPATKFPTNMINMTEMIDLNPQQNAAFNLGFCLAPEQFQLLDSDTLPRSITYKENDCQRKLIFNEDLSIQFSNLAIQKVPICASISFPVLHLSMHELDFGCCFVGQTREMEISMCNHATSDSIWTCSQDEECCYKEEFQVIPNCGKLDAHTSRLSTNKAVLHVYFTAKSAEPYETTFIIKGILGEKVQKFVVKGQGTLDGHFEALVNI